MKIIFTIILTLITFSNYSQDISIIKSEIFKDSKKRSSLKFSLDDGNGGLITIRDFYNGFSVKVGGYYIQHFDSNLKLIKEVEYETDNNYIKNAFVKEGKLHIIEYDFDKKNDTFLFNNAYANINDLNFSKKEILSSKYYGNVVISENKKFFVIDFDMENKDKETHNIFVFNDNFEKIYDQIIEKNVKDNFFDFNDIFIDNKGTVYLVGKYFKNQSKKKGGSNYYFEILKVNSDSQSSVNIEYADKFIHSLKLILSLNQLSCVGFYGKNDRNKINGICRFNFDREDFKIISKKFTPFTERFLTDKYGNKKSKKKRKGKNGIKNIDFKGIYAIDNGDIILNAEESYKTFNSYTDASGNNHKSTTYHFDDIISLRIDKNGDLKWARNINKRQTGSETSSYTSLSVGENSYFFINCSDKLEKLSADRIAFKQTKSYKSNLYYIKINENGDFDFKKLIDDKDSKVYYKVNNGIINEVNQTVILTGKRKKKTRVLKLKI